MKTIYDPKNRWLSAPPLVLSSTNKAPVAFDDTLNLLMDSGSVTVNVLANDFDPEGATLTLISANAALGTAIAEPDNTVTYTPPTGISGFDTVVYEIADDLDQQTTGQINITITEPQLSIDIIPGNTLVVNAETGSVQITVTAPANFAGTYAADTADLLGGPVNLAAPGIQGTAEVGSVLTAEAGLWINETGAGQATSSWQWLRGGAEIAGATSSSYTMTVADQGQGVSVRETLTDGFGQRFADSNPVSVFFTPASDTALLGWWDAADAGTIAETGGLVSSWADKSGGAGMVQSAGSQQPGTGTRTLNGLNVLDFAGNDFLQAGETLPVSGDVAFHMVVEVDTTANAFEAILAADATNDFQLDAENASQFNGRLNLAGVGSSVNLAGGPFAGAFLVSVIFDRTGSGQAEVFIGNVSRGVTAYTAPLDQFVDLILMSNRSKNAWVNGAVAEVVVTGDITNRADHHAYLAAKWGVS